LVVVWNRYDWVCLDKSGAEAGHHDEQRGSAMPTASRVLGVLTAAYGAAVVLRPSVLTGPLKLTGGGSPARPVRLLATAMGARDLAIGAAMAVAPEGRPLTVAVATRVAADVSDAVIFGTGSPDRETKLKAVAAALGWGALCAASLLGNRG
jgi:hypothetical protein